MVAIDGRACSVMVDGRRFRVPLARMTSNHRMAAVDTEVLGVAPAQVTALLGGEQDVWLSSCRDFFDSPFGTPGAACPTPFWACLGCANAVITTRKLPALLSFLAPRR